MPKVLIVDDSAFDRQRAGHLLESPPGSSTGFTAVYAAGGREALDVLERDAPDVVVTDLLMPDWDGLQLLREVAFRRPSVPVIVMTAAGSEEIALEALKRGAAGYVTKRTMAQNLLDTVESVLESSRLTRSHERLLECLRRCETRFDLTNDAGLIPPLVGHLKETLARMSGADDGELLRVTVAAREALLNAMHHGNLEVDSKLRENDDRAYADLIEERRGLPPYADRRVHVTATLTPREAVFVIRDEGPGFDPTALPDPTDPENLDKVSGRGLLLIRSFMSEVRHNAAGNEITLIWRAGKRE